MSEASTRPSGLAGAVESLDRLHPTAISATSDVRRLLEQLQSERVLMRRGMNRRIDPETAEVLSIEPDGVVLRVENFEADHRKAIFLNFAIDGQPYFFAAPFEADIGRDRIRVGFPSAIYRAERRSRGRRVPGEGEAQHVALEWAEKGSVRGEVSDASPGGMSVCVPESAPGDLEDRLRVRLLDGSSAGYELHAEVRSRASYPKRPGWVRIGLDVSPSPRSDALRVEHRDRVLDSTTVERAQRSWRVASAGVRVATDRALAALGRHARLPKIRVIDYANEDGEDIRAIVDSWGETRGATSVIIPPGWGRTKETLMPLAATLLAGFRAAGEPIVVTRFDGIRKRGESYNDPACRKPGKDHHRFTFSQGVRDIHTTLDYLERSPEFRPRKTILVSFSAASIEARRAVATDPRIDGWVCVVGAADAQSMMKVISGGIDYVAGVERGVLFGLQEVLGVEVDIDHAGRDLFAERLPCLEDSRRDFASIRVPVTWIHGKHDAWMDSARARDVLARGTVENRKFLEVPTGHMLKTSREALETFQLITGEVSTMALGRACRRALPDLGQLARRQHAERSRLPKADTADLREFWRGYLVGRNGELGIELMTHTTPYEELMSAQVELLDLHPGQLVADLGSGTGSFPVHLSRFGAPQNLRVLELDYVTEGLERARLRLEHCSEPETVFIETNLDLTHLVSIPVRSGAVDSVLAGFLLGYVHDPDQLLREILRILRPGGRLVVSSLRRDADVSKLYTQGIAELRVRGAGLELDKSHRPDVEVAARAYLNQASRLLDLEEAGRFRFWDPGELCDLVRRAGFTGVSGASAFGDPPQAVLVGARRPAAGRLSDPKLA